MKDFEVLLMSLLAMLNLIHAENVFPVFTQHLPSGDTTFPNDRCIKCRGDKLDICRSARIECRENEPAIEMIWTHSSKCEGSPNRVSYSVPSSFVTCPGPDHYSPMNVNMSRFVQKLQIDFKDSFPDNETAEAAILEYRRMLILNQKYPEVTIVPSPIVDKVWHTHILDTFAYHRDCLRMFGYYLHHAPSFGGVDEKVKLLTQHKDMLEHYHKHFGELPNGKIWPITMKKKKKIANDDDDKHYLPHCCAGSCVKVKCSYMTTDSGDCVGCDPLDCGYREVKWTDQPELMGSVAQPLSPARFGGYVPIEDPQHPFTHSITPFKKDGIKMVFQWNITGDSINVLHTLSGINAWYGLGFGTGDDRMNDGGMGMADYIITMYNRNYTGIFDMYLWHKGNSYPCWDVLYECSYGNKTKGTHDLTNRVVSRIDDRTTTTYSRKLNTGDYKDYIIKDKYAYLMFAYGRDDWFTEHKKKETCKVNLFTGSGRCGDDAWGLKAMRERLGCPSGNCPPR